MTANVLASRIPPPQPGQGPRYGTAFDVAMVGFAASVMRLRTLDPITTEIVRLRCARHHDCRMCRSVRYEDAREAGLTEDTADQIDRYEDSELLLRHKVALRLTDAMIMAPADLTPELRRQVREHFSNAEIAEIAFDIMKWSHQKALVALRIEPPPETEHTPLSFDEDGHPRLAGATPSFAQH